MPRFGHSDTSLAATPISAKERELLKMYRLVDMQMNPADHKWSKEETAAARDTAAEEIRNSLSLRDMARGERSFGRTNLAGAFTRRAPQSWKSAALQKLKESKFGHAHTSLAETRLLGDGPAFHAALRKISHEMGNPTRSRGESEAARESILRDLSAELTRKQVAQAQFGHAYSSLAATPLGAEDNELLKLLMQVDMQMPGADNEWTAAETGAARRAIVSKMKETLPAGNNAFGHAHTSLAGTPLDEEQRDLVQMFRLIDMQMNDADNSWSEAESDAARAAIMDEMKKSPGLQGFGHAYSSLHASPVSRTQHELASLFKALKIDMGPQDHVWSEGETTAARDAVLAKLKDELARTGFGHAYSSLAATKLDAGDTEVEKTLR